jgi:TM2 domain-containing membrane protein YozV
MSIIELLWKTFILLICSIIQVFGVLIEGIYKILKRVSELMESAHDKVLNWKMSKKKSVVANFDVEL